MDKRRQSIDRMADAIAAILSPCAPSIYLYGSATLGDFRPGWSDIDILCLTQTEIAGEQAEKLVGLRQAMLLDEPENRDYRAFEGGMLSLGAFLNRTPDRVVYWGTGGQRITDAYAFDSFCMTELLTCGVLLRGADVRGRMAMPGYDDLRADVARVLRIIRERVRATERNFYAFDWLLTIARCLYTLRTGRVIAKTAAGEWVLAEGLCPAPDALSRAVAVRKDAIRCRSQEEVFDEAERLGPQIQRFADVLEEELKKSESSGGEWE